MDALGLPIGMSAEVESQVFDPWALVEARSNPVVPTLATFERTIAEASELRSDYRGDG